MVAPGDDPCVLPFGEDVTRNLEDGVEVEARAEWENGRVVVTRGVGGGASVTETYMPSVDGTRLTVAVEVSMGGRGGVEFRRVYTQPAADEGS